MTPLLNSWIASIVVTKLGPLVSIYPTVRDVELYISSFACTCNESCEKSPFHTLLYMNRNWERRPGVATQLFISRLYTCDWKYDKSHDLLLLSNSTGTWCSIIPTPINHPSRTEDVLVRVKAGTCTLWMQKFLHLSCTR